MAAIPTPISGVNATAYAIEVLFYWSSIWIDGCRGYVAPVAAGMQLFETLAKPSRHGITLSMARSLPS